MNTVISYVVTYGPMAIAAASAATAVLPQTGPSWWVAARKAVDILAFNFGNAKNLPRA